MNRTKRRKSIDWEGPEQTDVFTWIEIIQNVRPDLLEAYAHHEGVYKSKTQRGKSKAQGMKSGIPDIFLPVAKGGYHGLYIEMKRPANKAYQVAKGTVSIEQKERIKRLKKRGYLVIVAYGSQEAIDALIKYDDMKYTVSV
jgi:hypothetical protein